MDVDNFKHYNDFHGHLAGDIILKEFAGVLKNIFGKNGMVGRYGGDEFVVFIKGNLERTQVESRLRQAKDRLSKIRFSEKNTDQVTFSAGLARFPEDGNTYERLCESADKALYRVKEHGKNNFEWYDKIVQ